MRFSVKRTDNDKDMIEEYQLRVLPETAANEQALRRYVAREKGKDERTLTAIRVLKRSIDARQRTIFVNLKLRVYVNEQPECGGTSAGGCGRCRSRRTVCRLAPD